jgi:hypothetical protein
VRGGFIGEPFGSLDSAVDYVEHADGLDIAEIDNNTLLLVFDVHSEAGEGVAEMELRWEPLGEQPELHVRSAHIGRWPLASASRASTSCAARHSTV